MRTVGDGIVAQIGGRLTGQLYVDRDRDHRRTVFLAGSGRSGTTWLAQVLNHDNAYRYLHEPFHRHKVPAARSFGYRQYLRPGDRDPEFLDGARRIVTGDVRNLWVDKHNRRRVAERRLVKEVRANLFLKWLHGHFSGMPIVLLLRHPCAVAASRMRVDWSGGAELRTFLRQPALLEDWLAPFAKEMGMVEDPFERMIWFWCVENVVPLRQFSPGEVHVVLYEHLVLHPERELERLFRALGRAPDPRAVGSAARPSSATRRDSAVLSGGDLLEAWRSQLSAAQVELAVEILGRFGLDEIYGVDALPRTARGEEVLRR